MLSPEERKLLTGILVLLLLGAAVKGCRQRVVTSEGAKQVLPSVEAPGTPAD